MAHLPARPARASSYMKNRVDLGQGKNQLVETRQTDFWGLAVLGDRSDDCQRSTCTSPASVGGVWGKSPPSVRTLASTGGRSGVGHFCCRIEKMMIFCDFHCFLNLFPATNAQREGLASTFRLWIYFVHLLHVGIGFVNCAARPAEKLIFRLWIFTLSEIYRCWTCAWGR